MVSSFLLIFGRFRMGSALRGRGKALNSAKLPGAIGSPPRGREKEPRGSIRRADTGITPACAGKSTRYMLTPPDTGDHPRVCGEKTKKVQENQRSFAACSSNFIQFLVHCKRQAAVRQRAMRARNIQTKVRGQRSQLVIRHVVQLPFCHPQCVRVGVLNSGK